jgi:putative ABC transport system permease protein
MDRQESSSGILSTLAVDLRQSFRRLRRHPEFSLPAVLTLALGLGATIATFAVLHAVVLEPLPYRQPERLVRIQTAVPGVGAETRWGLAKGQYLYFQKEARSFSALGLYQLARVTLEPQGDGEARSVDAASVSSALFPTLGVEPLLGRLPEAADHLAAEPQVAWLSHELWQERFGGDRAIVGRTIPVDGRSLEVVGVLGPNARLPEESVLPDFDVGLWLPLWLDPLQPPQPSHVFRALGRLGDGVALEAAAKELDQLTLGLPVALPGAYSERYLTKTKMRPELVPLRDDVLGETIVRSLWILFGSVLLLLIIAGANVTNLFLARAEAGRRETALRMVLGAGRGRLLAGFLTESMLIAAFAGGLGLLLAYAALRVLRAAAPSDLPRLEAIALDGGTFAFALALAVAIGLLYGLLPALLRYDSRDIATGARQTLSRRGRYFRNALVVGQVALSLVLLTAGGLLFRSFRSLLDVEPGFEAAKVLTFSVVLPGGRYDSYERVGAAYSALAEGLEQADGVEHAAVAMTLPMTGFDGCSALFVDGQSPAPGEQALCVPLLLVSPGYFATLGIPVQGQAPTWGDAAQRLPQAVVSASLARRLWPQTDALGHTLTLSLELDPFTVVGVAGDVRGGGLDQAVTDAVYLPMTPPPGPELWPPLTIVHVVARAANTRPVELAPVARRVVAGFDPQIPIRDLRPMAEIVKSSMSRLTFSLLLVGAAAAIAFLLSAVGIYGTVSYLVVRRRTELGVRMALGARREQVRGMVVGESLRLAVVGVALGLAAALAATQVLRSLLYGVSARDPLTLVVVALFLLALSVVASWVPALRASRLPPSEALREE